MLNLTKWKAIVGALFLTIGSVSAQDVIVLKDTNEIKALVTEVDSQIIKYKKWTFQTGPIFTLETNKIFVIKYRNGEKQTFSDKKTQSTSTTTAPNTKVETAQTLQPAPANNTTPAVTQTYVQPQPTYQPAPAPVTYQPTTKPAEPQPRTTYTSSTQTATKPVQQAIAKQESNKQQSVSSNKFQPEFVAGGYAGYTLGLGDYALDAINLGMKVRYRFNPYLAVGATAGTSLFYDLDETSGTVNITADVQGILPLSEKVSLYGEVGIGVGIGYGWCDTNYLIQVGPGIRIGRVSIAALYNKFGEGDGGMSFQIGFGF